MAHSCTISIFYYFSALKYINLTIQRDETNFFHNCALDVYVSKKIQEINTLHGSLCTEPILNNTDPKRGGSVRQKIGLCPGSL